MKKVSVEEFVSSVNQDKDFNQIYEDEVFRITSFYKPPELVALSDLRGVMDSSGSVDKATFDRRKEKFSNALYFNLKIGLKDGSDILESAISNRQQYALRLNELTFNMNRCFYILSGTSDTIRASLYDFQRSYGMSPDVSFLFAFPSTVMKLNDKTLRLVYDDRLFGVERPVTFLFEKEKLNKSLPEIIFKNN